MKLFALIALVAIPLFTISCPKDSTSIFENFITSVNQHSIRANSQIKKANKSYIRKYFRAENKLHRKLCKSNPELADYLFSQSIDPLFYHQNDALVLSLLKSKIVTKEPFPFQDSISSALSLIAIRDTVLNKTFKANLETARTSSAELKNKLEESEKLQQYFRGRKSILKEAAKTEIGINFKDYDKVNYYYKAQVAEYRSKICEPDAAEKVAMELLRNNRDFKTMLERTGFQASFPKVPSDWGKGAEGLQTTQIVKSNIQKDISLTKQGSQSFFANVITPMRALLSKMKTEKFEAISNAGDIPEFTPNPLKTKSLLKRLEYGSDYEIKKSNYYFPSQASIALHVGYKFNTKFTLGIGGAYNFCLGKGWNDFRFQMESICTRIYSDYKISGFFYLCAEADRIKQNQPSQKESKAYLSSGQWDSSALVGLKMKYTSKTSLITTATLLYDFLAARHHPQSACLVYRLGWEFGSK